MRMTAVILAACALAGCGGGQTKAPPAPPVVEMTPAEKAALLATYPEPYKSADLENGRRRFGVCRSCHSIEPGGPNMTGPNLHGVFGRKAASVSDYRYSEALTTSGIVWDASHLDRWLDQPRSYLPGTKMTFAGMSDAKDRTDLIAYLMVETGHHMP